MTKQTMFLARWSTYRDMTGPIVVAKDTRDRFPRVGDWVTLVTKQKRWPAEVIEILGPLPSGDIRIVTTRGGVWHPIKDPFLSPSSDNVRSNDPDDDVPF